MTRRAKYSEIISRNSFIASDLRLSRRQRILIFKVSALLSLLRWYNLFFLALAQYLTALFILNEPSRWIHTLLNPDLHLIVLSSLLCVAGGYIINNFYDLEKDLINRPRKTLYEKLVKQATALRLYFVLNVLAALLAMLVSFNVFLYFSSFIFLLWLYSHKLKKITFLGNLIAALLTIVPFLSVFIYYQLQDLLIITYISFIFSIIFIREVIKDMETLKGDMLTGYPTLPSRIGLPRTKWFVAVVAALSMVPAFAIFYATAFQGISYYLAAGVAGVMLSLGYMIPARKKSHFEFLNNVYRFLIICGILSLLLFSR